MKNAEYAFIFESTTDNSDSISKKYAFDVHNLASWLLSINDSDLLEKLTNTVRSHQSGNLLSCFDTIGMSKNTIDFLKSLFDKYHNNLFSSEDQAIFDLAAKFKIIDYRKTLKAYEEKGLIRISKNGTKIVGYTFIMAI